MQVRISTFLSAVFLISLQFCSEAQTISNAPLLTVNKRTQIVEGYGKLPLAFERNEGQANPAVKFLSRGPGYALFLTPAEAVLTLESAASSRMRVQPTESGRQQSASVLRMKLRNADTKTMLTGEEELAGVSNYFVGNDSRNWQWGVHRYGKVRYSHVYPGVDLVYYGNQRQLEYDFVLQPGADPAVIRLGIEGAKKVRIERGDVVLTTAGGDIRLQSPHIYQETSETRREVRGKFVIVGKSEIGFHVPRYDRTHTLIIDPVLAYLTNLGGTGWEQSAGIAVDSVGNAYVTGYTRSGDFPSANPIQPSRHGKIDAFVTKINPEGTDVVYSTYLGGATGSSSWQAESRSLGIGVDATGNAYIAGFTYCSDFPVLNALQLSLHGVEDAFVAKINSSGSLAYSTYLGGNSTDEAWAIAVDMAGDAYVTGTTHSPDYPTSNAVQPTLAGYQDAFVTKISPDGKSLMYSTFLGGDTEVYGPGTWGYGIATDSGGNAYVTGYTETAGFPTFNAIQPTLNGARNAFVSKINASGSAFIYSTYLGGTGDDRGTAIAADAMGNAYVTGLATSSDFPTINPLQTTRHGDLDAFVTKINPSGNAFVYSTYLGGTGREWSAGIATDVPGHAFVMGTTDSRDFPLIHAFQSNSGIYKTFLTEIGDDGNALIYSTFLSRFWENVGAGIAVDSAGSAYLTGHMANRSDATPLAFQPHLRSSIDTFVSKIAPQTFVRLSVSKPVWMGPTLLGTTTLPKAVYVYNTGTTALTINRVFIGGKNPGDFAQTNTCGSSISAGGFCSIFVTFTPTARFPRSAAVGISDSDLASPHAVELNGTGTVVSLSTSRLVFRNQPIGTSGTHDVILTNVGNTPLNFTSVTIEDLHKPSHFTQVNTCGTSIPAGGTCAITVKYSPTILEVWQAVLSIRDDGGHSPQNIVLIGSTN
jgi:hypothetical protein